MRSGARRNNGPEGEARQPDGRIGPAVAYIFCHGANILDSDQHSDMPAGQFFQRIRFDLSELLTDRGTLERAIDEVAARFEMKVKLSYESNIKRVAVFGSTPKITTKLRPISTARLRS